MGFFTRKPQPAPPAPAIWEHNSHFGRPFNVAVQMCQDSEELAALVVGYKMSTKELDCFCERMEVLYFEEDMALYEIAEATPAAIAQVTDMFGANHPRYNYEVKARVAAAVQLKRDTETMLRATTQLSYMTEMRDVIRHAELVGAIENNAPETMYSDLKNNPVVATVFGLAASRRRT